MWLVNGCYVLSSELKNSKSESYFCLDYFIFCCVTVTLFFSDNFVDPITGTHTQNVERFWRSMKSKLKKMYGCQTSQLESHLDEFQWRYIHDRVNPGTTLNNLWAHMREWQDPDA